MRALLPGLCGLVLLLVHAPARAQDITAMVRAGEHADFTRVVLSLPDGTDWRLQENGRSVDLLVTDRAVTFDLSQAFARIPRTRLRSVERVTSGIRLVLGCDCPVRLVDGIAGQVVLDIVTPTDVAEQPVETAPRPRPRLAPDPQAGTSRRAGTALAQSLRGTPTTPEDLGAALRSARFPRAVPDTQTPPQANDSAVETVTGQLLSSTLAQAIAGAVAENLLSPDGQFRATPSGTAPSLAVAALPHILSQSAAGVQGPEACTSAVSRMVPDWSVEPDAWSDWSKMFDPLDQLDPDGAMQTSRTLLRLSMGAEARQVLRLLPQTPENVTLQQLSYVLDLEPPPQPDLLGQHAACSDLDALWAFLATPGPGPLPDGMDHSIVRAMQNLSRPLRLHLGPAVVHQMLRHGAEDVAKLVEAGLARAQGSADPVTEPDLLLGQAPERLEALGPEELAALSNEDIVMILENAQSRLAPLPAAFLAEATGRQFAHRRSDMGDKLGELTALALAMAGNFDAAFELVRNRDSGLDPATMDRVRQALFEELVTSAPDTEFVMRVFDEAPWTSDTLPNGVRDRLGTRLAGLGFATEARELQQPGEARETATPVPAPAPEPRDSPPAGPEPDQTIAQSVGPRRPAATLEPQGIPAAPIPDIAAAEPALIADAGDAPTGPLGAGRAALQSSEALRSQVLDLLAAGPGPALP